MKIDATAKLVKTYFVNTFNSCIASCPRFDTTIHPMGLLHTLCVVAVVGVTYHATLFDTIPGGDSGELVAEACALGTPHPPG